MWGFRYILPFEIKNTILLKLFPSKRRKIKFFPNIELEINLSEYRYIVGILDCGYKLKRYEDNSFVFEFHKFLLSIPREKLKYMPGVFDKNSPIWKVENLNGKVVVDIGGFIGETALFFLSKGAKKVIVYEPVEENVNYIKRNLYINSVLDLVDVRNVGVNYMDGEIEIEYEEFGADFGRSRGNKNIKINVVSLEKVLEEGSDLIKFNCEGCESAILKVEKNKLKNIDEYIIQAHNYELSMNIKNLFLELGYELILEYKHNTKTPIYTFYYRKP
ncbi:MAG: FkbM family methyltransferase [candidate division WOR-3 bacterium]|nr:FkbM family methyltransferase [candidate division WOR-3 bacterium]